jgi:Family of unknown function (DUF6159)
VFERIAYSWELMKASWDVLRKDKALLLFPLLSGVCCLIVLASFALPIAATGSWRNMPGRDTDVAHKVIYYGVIFLFYFTNYFVITFFNVGIVACAVQTLRGEEAGVAYGFGQAMARIHLIVGWSLLSATVGLLLRLIAERSEKVGQIVADILGGAWSVMSFLVVPVLVVENKGPFAALKESTVLLKKTWGERLAASFGFGAIFILMALPGVALIIFAGYAFVSLNNHPVGIAAAAVAVLYWITLALISSALQSIFQAAIYLHTQSALVPATARQSFGFPVQLLNGAMVAKR